MKKVVILGCENSHADNFLKLVVKEKAYDDIQFLGVYSDEVEASKKLADEFGVSVMDNYADAVGKVDGVIVTARHGDNHYKYARPYIESGVPMFIDKPITVSEQEAVEMMRQFRKYGVKFTGGSSCVYSSLVPELKKIAESKSEGRVYGGFLRAPVSLSNPYGDFFFYAQHMVEVASEIFGYYPKSVLAIKNGDVVTVTVRYNEYDIALEFTDQNYKYYAYLSTENGMFGGEFIVDDDNFKQEFAHYYSALNGKEQEKDAREFIAPVFVMNAIFRSLESGKEEKVNPVEEI